MKKTFLEWTKANKGFNSFKLHYLSNKGVYIKDPPKFKWDEFGNMALHLIDPDPDMRWGNKKVSRG